MTLPSYGDRFVDRVDIDPVAIPVATGADAAWARGTQVTHVWYRSHGIEIHSGSSRQGCLARVALILYETPHTWSELAGWPAGEQWGHTLAEAVATVTNTATAWIDARADRNLEADGPDV